MLRINYFKILQGLISIALALLLLCLFSSCNTVHKTTQSSKENVDSVHVAKSESATVNKKDSTGTKTETGNYEKETVYQYDTVYQIIKGDTILKYVPRIIKVYEKGNYIANETATKSSIDSSGSKAFDSARLTKKIEVKNTDKKSSRMPIGLIVGIVFGAIVIGAVIIWKPKFLA